MRLLDVFYDVSNSEPAYYDYWFEFNGVLYFMTLKEQYDIFKDKVSVSNMDILRSIGVGNKPCFILYELIEPYLNIEIEFEDSVNFTWCQRNPLICIRGTCDKQCNRLKNLVDFYCFQELPCFNSRPDWNVWSTSNPNFCDLLKDIMKFITLCPHTSTFITIFEYTPTAEEPELSFEYCTGILIKNTSVTIIKNSSRIKDLYDEYNKKYPTEDRQIEASISEPEVNFNFKL